MNLAEYVKCLKKFALNKKTSDEEFLNAVLKPYIDAGEVDNKNNEEIFCNCNYCSNDDFVQLRIKEQR